MASIQTRLKALAARVRQQERPEIPYEELDPLSQALVDLASELASLDTVEKKAEYCKAHGWEAEELECFIQEFAALDDVKIKY